jgi:hypothetical protein
MGAAHEDAIHRARFYAQRTKHALGIVDAEACDAKAFASGNPLFANVDAIHRAGL